MCAIFQLQHIFHPLVFKSYASFVHDKNVFGTLCRKTTSNDLACHIVVH